MTPGPEIGAAVVAKLIGATAGAIVALVFILPKTIYEFIQRLATSLVSGVIFAPFVRAKLGIPPDFEGRIAGAFIAAFCAWWAMGAVHRIIGAWKGND